MHKHFKDYTRTEKEIKSVIEEIQQDLKSKPTTSEELNRIISFIDLTTLEGTDNDEKIISLCNRALHLTEKEKAKNSVAAVCFYPNFAELANQVLKNTDIQVAVVAGAFPSGQSPLDVRVAEVKHAVAHGADEIDMVISRGKFLEGDFIFVSEEVKAIKGACGRAHLKVILETGELQSIPNIRKASEIAIEAGADFIKTSTGKVQPAATPEAMFVMAETVKEYFESTGIKIGLKPAGGISDTQTARLFIGIIEHVLGTDWLNNSLFRIGASRLLNDVISHLD